MQVTSKSGVTLLTRFTNPHRIVRACAGGMYGDDAWTKVIKQVGSDNDNSQDEPDSDRKFMLRAFRRIETNPPQYLRTRLKQYPRLFLDSGDYLLSSSNITFDEALQKLALLVLLWQRERPPEPIPATFVLSGSPYWTPLRNFLLTATTEMFSFLQEWQEAR